MSSYNQRLADCKLHRDGASCATFTMHLLTMARVLSDSQLSPSLFGHKVLYHTTQAATFKALLG